MDLIKRQAAVNILANGLDKIPMVNNTANEMIRRDERIICIQEIRSLPSTHPEIIRCKDCKHRPIKGDWNIVYAPDDSDGRDDDTCPCLCDDCCFSWMPEDDFFCKRGERKE